MPRSRTPVRKRKKNKKYNYNNFIFYIFIIILFWVYNTFFNPSLSLISLL